MTLDFTQLDNDLKFMHSDVPKYFKYLDVVYTGSTADYEEGGVYSMMGEADGVNETIIANVSDFVAESVPVPGKGDFITINGTITTVGEDLVMTGGQELRVYGKPKTDTAGIGVNIELGDKYKE